MPLDVTFPLNALLVGYCWDIRVAINGTDVFNGGAGCNADALMFNPGDTITVDVWILGREAYGDGTYGPWFDASSSYLALKIGGSIKITAPISAGHVTLPPYTFLASDLFAGSQLAIEIPGLACYNAAACATGGSCFGTC